MNTGMEYEDILMRNQELMAIINRLTIERDELVTKTYKLEKERDDAREQEERFSDDALRLMHERNNALRERDEARRMYCQQIANESIDTEQQIAEHKGWDCYKEPYCFRVNGVVVSKEKAVPPKFELGEDDK